MSTNIVDIVALVRPLSGDSDPEVRQFSDSDIRAFILVVSAAMPFTVTIVDKIEISEDLTSAQISRISCECAVLMISGTPDEFSYKTPVLSVKRKSASSSDRLDGIRELLAKLEDPAISWDDEINKILYDYDRYLDALTGMSDA